MDINQILDTFPFLDSNDILHRDQLESYDDWVINGLDYDNVHLILEYLQQYPPLPHSQLLQHRSPQPL